MIASDSTGGTSQRSGNSPVLFFDFLSLIKHWKIYNDDKDVAYRLFISIGYQHIVPYLLFLRKTRIRGGHSISELELLITLEREMSNLILNEIGLIEHQVKTRFAYGIQAVHGDNGLYNPENFKHKREHKQGLFSIQRELERQKKWRTNTSSVPASTWVSLEYATLGAVSRLLNNVRSKEVVQCVSDSFSVNNRCLRNWARYIALIRNACAHFEPFIVRPQAPIVPKGIYGFEKKDPTKPLYALLVIERLLQGRIWAGIEGAKDDYYNFVYDTTIAFSEFAEANPALAKKLCIPRKYLAAQGMKRLHHIVLRHGTAECKYYLAA